MGLKTHSHREWLLTDTQKRENPKRQQLIIVEPMAQEEYIEVNKNVKRSIKADRRNYIEMLVTEAEAAAHHGNTQELYTTFLSGKLSGKIHKSRVTSNG